ncbi:hypothetical protein PGH12_02565 [Chryseobacterium wangxinyae]|uniref:hypothetical protein n=1 Tax=Chryseobacterium sp. CY350 TaxID=2997336 RepID=UPI0022709A01|nr:hypothetical protein [Chryseobacterium sp. CY350]MCY0978260.1 hypothetical protein [Chryseobacterium sp. CY350]WBZ96038.1 hypothetical protein PGH12_02565 [Chryseobacterium sp. CY350]
MRIFILSFMLLLCTSCASEGIEFRTKNYLKIYNDELTVKLIPRKKTAKVILTYYDTVFETNAPKKPRILRIANNRKRKTVTNISVQKYKDIIISFKKIDENLLKYPKTGIDSLGNSYIISPWPDSPSTKIIYKSRHEKKEISARGLHTDYGDFFTTSKMMLENANVPIDSLYTFGFKKRIIE